MVAYDDQLAEILKYGEDREDRTGTGTRSLFGLRMEFDLERGFPATTRKKLYWKGVVGELIWFLSGDTNIGYLQDNGIHIWDEWADENGDLGPVYGAQWRRWGNVDQIRDLIENLISRPYSRRHVVSAWNVGELADMALPPCHLLFQFYVRKGGLLDCQLYQRSADMFLGVPFNIASYSLLTHMIAEQTGYKAGKFIHTIGDAHIYHNHLAQVETYLEREPFPEPYLELKRGVRTIDEYEIADCQLKDYQYHPTIKAPVAV